MGIDLKTETPIGLGQAARVLPPGRGGRPVHISSLVRAILAGELEALRFGRRWVTTVEAVQQWDESRARAAGAGPMTGPSTGPAKDSAGDRGVACVRSASEARRGPLAGGAVTPAPLTPLPGGPGVGARRFP